jgi:hypothetical protein
MSYTLSDNMERSSFLNQQDTITGFYEERLAEANRRHRWVISGIWELPFGRGRHFGSGWNKAVDGVLGGWQVTGIGQLQTGGPLNFDANYIYRGDRNAVAISGKPNIDLWFNTSGFERNANLQLAPTIARPRGSFPGRRLRA